MAFLWWLIILNTFVCMHVLFFVTLWTIAHQAPLSTGFSRQEHWSRLPCPPPGDLPDSGIKSTSLGAPTLEAESLPLNHQESPIEHFYIHLLVICMSLLEKCLFKCSVHLKFFIELYEFLYSLYNNWLSNKCFPVFSPWGKLPFSLFFYSLVMQKYSSLI